jgi:D-alanyl-D-alanine carboxypeptidase/D-alanyl-D-alanine-endopeptidase (penicillin-binding protein 4)
MLMRFAALLSSDGTRSFAASGWRSLLAIGICVWLVPGAQATESGGLTKRLDRLVSRGPLAGASLGIYVERARDGKPLYSRGADQLLIPASNQKILTTLAALQRFGPSFRFETRIWAPEAPNADGVVEALIVEGRGDPVMNSEDWWRLAADLRREGLRGIEGDLRVDDSLFDGPGWHPSWGRVSARAYHAPIGALTANYGSYFVSVWPQSDVGSSALVDIDPPVPYLHLRNLAKTAARSARPRLSVDRVRGARKDGSAEEIVRVQGVTRIGDDVDRFPRSVLDPGLYAGSLLAYQLAANGIYLDGDVRRAPRGDAPATLVLERPGRALAEIVQLCMKYSNNSIAESLVKSLAAYSADGFEGRSSEAPTDEPVHQGTWTAGVRAVRAELAELHVDLSGATLVDGSGLSLQNRVSPRMLVRALRAGRESFRIGPEFVASLPIAERDGTLEKRLRGGDGRIRAKTGLLSDASVTALSGFAERPDGETLVFSILVNGHAGGSGPAMDAVDEIAWALLEAPLPAAGGAGVAAAPGSAAAPRETARP